MYNTLVKKNKRDTVGLIDDFFNLGESIFSQPALSSWQGIHRNAIEVSEDKNNVYVHAELPGVAALARLRLAGLMLNDGEYPQALEVLNGMSGDAFGGRDHTTVLHGCRRIEELRETDKRIDDDYLNLLRTLTG